VLIADKVDTLAQPEKPAASITAHEEQIFRHQQWRPRLFEK
jgi:hypothetical protein